MLKTLVIAGSLVLAATPASGQTITEIGDRVMADFARETSESAMLAAQDDLGIPLTDSPSIYEFKSKSPGRAFLYSLILPGAGQVYSGSKIKAGIFLALEAAAWGGRFHYRGQGNDQTDTYEAFARAHWSDVPYFDSLKSVYNIDRWQDGNAQWAHHLPFQVNGVDTTANLNHEYYENVGKYQQFVWGWDDLQKVSDTATADENDYLSVNRGTYVVMREDANRSFDRARKISILIIGNHLISAFDAALSARRHNRSSDHARKVGVSVQLVEIEETPTPWVTVAYRF